MEWLEAIAAAYSAADEYYKRSAENQFRDAVLRKLAAIHATTQATLAIAEALLAWTKDAPRLIKLFDVTSNLKVAGEHLELLFPNLEGSGKKNQDAKRQIVELHTQIVSHTLFLKDFGGFIAFPQVAYGVALILIINRQRDISPRESLPDFLKKILAFYRDCLREIPDVDPYGQRRVGWQYLHAKELREQYVPFLNEARLRCYEDNKAIVARMGISIGRELGAYVGMRGNWSDGFQGISSLDPYSLKPENVRTLVNFVPALGSITITAGIDLEPLGRVDEGTARNHGDRVAGELGGMIHKRNWAVSSEAMLGEACSTLRDMVSKLEAIVGPSAEALGREPPFDQRAPALFD